MNFRSPLLVTTSLVALLSSCASAPPPSLDPTPQYDTSPTYPHWAGRAATWSKLGEIEDWLAGSSPRQHPEFVSTAELELAEGRLALTQREVGLAAPLVAGRLKSAEEGFEGLLAKPGVKPAIRMRAERGLKQIEALRSAGVVAKPASPAPFPASAPAGLTVQPRAAWNAAGPTSQRLTSVGGGWNRITIHHSAKYSREIGAPSNRNVAEAIRDIQTVHMRDEGYGDIGYHFLVDPVGRVWQGRSLEWQGAHAGGANGANNVGNIGICVLGDFSSERPDPRTLAALETLVDALCERHRIARARLFGHRQMRNTECPGDALMAWVSSYAAGLATGPRASAAGRESRPQTKISAVAPTAVQ